MSYFAEGSGGLALLNTDKAVEGLRDAMVRYFQEQGEDVVKNLGSLGQSAKRQYDAQAQRLAGINLSDRNKFFATMAEILEDAFRDVGFCDIWCAPGNRDDCIFIDVAYDGNYNEEGICALIDTLIPYTVHGQFTFDGEDDSHWRLRFDGTDWVEESGEIVYDETKPDVQPFFPAFDENTTTLTTLMREIETRMDKDERSPAQRCHELLRAYKEKDPDGMLAALTGWDLASLGALAGVWKDEKGVVAG